MIVSSSAAISINFWTNIDLTIMFYIIFLSCSICATQVMAVSVNLFPTNYRSMATSFMLMCARIGGAFGSNAVGFLLQGHCTKIFYISAAALISAYFNYFIFFFKFWRYSPLETGMFVFCVYSFYRYRIRISDSHIKSLDQKDQRQTIRKNLIQRTKHYLHKFVLL